jgi:hypothetical protein
MTFEKKTLLHMVRRARSSCAPNNIYIFFFFSWTEQCCIVSWMLATLSTTFTTKVSLSSLFLKCQFNKNCQVFILQSRIITARGLFTSLYYVKTALLWEMRTFLEADNLWAILHYFYRWFLLSSFVFISVWLRILPGWCCILVCRYLCCYVC